MTKLIKKYKIITELYQAREVKKYPCGFKVIRVNILFVTTTHTSKQAHGRHLQ
jgi:hypothetical protein